MPRITQAHTSSQPFMVNCHLEIIELDSDVFLYRRELSSHATAEAIPAHLPLPKSAGVSSVQTGVVDKQGCDALLAGEAPDSMAVLAFTTAELETFRLTGFVDGMQRAERVDIWTRFNNDASLTADNLVRVDPSSHMIFNRHGEVLPTAQHFDYIKSRIDESSHDLLAVAKHLLTRPDVMLYSGNSHRGALRADNLAKNAKDAIYHIPSYNSEEGRTQGLQFTWIPDPDDFRRVWSECRGEYPSTQIRDQFMELDILGIKDFEVSKKSLRPRP